MRRLAALAAFAALSIMPLVAVPLFAPSLYAQALLAQTGRLTPEEQKQGWQSLFDGTDMQGWHDASGGPAGAVQVQGGVLTLQKSEHLQGDIVTDRVFGDFELTVDFNIESGGNSGIKYFVNDQVNAAANDHQLGFEYQVLDDDRHPDAKLGRNGDRKTASLYDILPAHTAGAYRGPGVWNTARIVVRGNHGEHWLNGVKVLEYDRTSSDFQAALAQSKFKNFKGFGSATDGHILLQDHGDTVHFRNIKVRPLAADADAHDQKAARERDASIVPGLSGDRPY